MRQLLVSQSVFAGLGSSFVERFDGHSVGWRRSRSRVGGDVDGRFSLVGNMQDLATRFYSWLGYDVREDASGDQPWCGYVQSMTLHYGGRSRRRSLDEVINAVRVHYGWLIDNGEFEILGSGVTFSGWSEVTTGGSINDETTNVGQYDHAVRLVNTSGTPYVYQDFAVIPERMYRLGFLTRGDGSLAGRYQVYDVTNAANIIASTSTGVTGTTYVAQTVDFRTPAACVSVRIMLQAPAAAGTSYFDAAWVKRFEEDEYMPEVTDWATNTESINRYGRREGIVQLPTASQAAADGWATNAVTDGAWPAVSDPVFGGGEGRLDVDVVGYWATASMRYHTQDILGNKDAGDVIGDIITNDCDWLTELTVASIGTDGQARTRDHQTARAAIDALLPSHYRLRVDEQRRVIVEAIDTTPIYYMQTGQLYETPGTARPVDAQAVLAGVAVQDLDWAELSSQVDGRTASASVFILNDFDVDESGTIIPRG